MTDADARPERAAEDVVAVERIAPGMVRVVSWSGSYTVDARGEGCTCPDKQYNGVDRCKHQWAAILATSDRPAPFDVTDSLDAPRLMADGGGKWAVHDRANDNTRTFDSRSDAEDAKQTCEELGGDPTVYPPGESPGDDAPEPEPDGGDAEVVETHTIAPDPDAEPATPDEAVELEPRSVADDPIAWMPSEFVDEIEGVMAINRKGFEVLSHFYDISVHADVQVPPEETGFEFARVKAVATTAGGRVCEAFGSAHVDRDDDPEILLEMADTRARKRALSIASGAGAIAVEELKSEVDR